MEGYYEVNVQAAQHSSFRGNTFVTAGRTNEFEPFVSRSLVEYIWTVVPTEIEDRTRIVIETIFETVVPLPVITVEPAFIDLANCRKRVADRNPHLESWPDRGAECEIELPTDGGGVTFQSIVTEIGTLPANSSMTIPVIIRQPIDAPALPGQVGEGRFVAESLLLLHSRSPQIEMRLAREHVLHDDSD